MDSDDFADVVGEEMRALRMGTGLTQAEMGAEVKVSGAAVSNWEEGRTGITLANFFVYCLAVGDHPSDVMRRIEQRMMLEF